MSDVQMDMKSRDMTSAYIMGSQRTYLLVDAVRTFAMGTTKAEAVPIRASVTQAVFMVGRWCV